MFFTVNDARSGRLQRLSPLRVLVCVLFCGFAVPASAQERVPPNARLAWTLEGTTENQSRALRFTLYVDGLPSSLSNVECSALAGVTAVECAGSIPRLAPGPHVLQVSSTRVANGIPQESTRSDPFHVVAETDFAATRLPAAETSARDVPAPADIDVDIQLVTSGLSSPADLAVASGGRILVAERDGTIRQIRNGVLNTEPLLRIEASASGFAALLSLALDPEFDRNGFTYVAYAWRNGNAATYEVARYRYAAGTLGERAILLDNIPADPNRLAATIRVRADGTLSAAFGDTQAGERHVPSSYNGKVLRLTRDGRTPRDHPMPSPIVAAGIESPRGLTWDAATGALWLLDQAAGQSQVHVISDFAVASDAGSYVLAMLPGLKFGPAEATALAFYDAALIPELAGHLLITTSDGLRAANARPVEVFATSMLTIARRADLGMEPAHAVTVSSTGDIYVATETRVFRLSPRR